MGEEARKADEIARRKEMELESRNVEGTPQSKTNVKSKDNLEKVKELQQDEVPKITDNKISFVPGYIEKDSSLENFAEIEAVQELIQEEANNLAKKRAAEEEEARKANEYAKKKAAEEEN